MAYDNLQFPREFVTSEELAIMETLKTLSAVKDTPVSTILAATETMLLRLRLLEAYRDKNLSKLRGTEFARIYHGYEVSSSDDREMMVLLQPHIETLHSPTFQFHRWTLLRNNSYHSVSDNEPFGSGLFIGDTPTKKVDPNLGTQAEYDGLPGQVQDGLKADDHGPNTTRDTGHTLDTLVVDQLETVKTADLVGSSISPTISPAIVPAIAPVRAMAPANVD